MIAIVDYGLGNINAFINIFKKLHTPIVVAKNKDTLINAEKIILPGVGAFDFAMNKLNSSGMRETLDDLVLGKKIPVIGICVGMQILANSSDEGRSPGLGYIDSEVKKFQFPENSNIYLPHMGWNDVYPANTSTIFKGLENPLFYFLHSYYFKCNNERDILAKSNYGNDFVCATNKENIYGVQFHPEKSHQYGIKLLENFSKL